MFGYRLQESVLVPKAFVTLPSGFKDSDFR